MMFLVILFYLAIILFAIYFVIKIMNFMDSKLKLDQERNEKIEELIKVVKQENTSK